jgi:hypothetical protein
MTAKALQKKQEQALASLDTIFDEDAGAGMEDLDREEIAIPMLAILQKGSPQCDPDDGAFIDGAKPGMIFNTASEELYDGESGIYVVAVFRKRSWIEWVPKNAGGGFVGEYDAEPAGVARSDDPNQSGYFLPNGNQINDTRTFLVYLIHKDGTYEPAMLSMTSTQIPKAKKWVAVINKQRLPNGKPAPIYYRIWHLLTIPESNDKGSWRGWRVQGPIALGDSIEGYDAPDPVELITDIKTFRESLAAGEVKTDPAQEAKTQSAPVDSDPAAEF